MAKVHRPGFSDLRGGVWPGSAQALAEEVGRARRLDIAFERVGDGPPIVFVHGGADDHRIWQPQLDALADEFTVVAWDEPGAGRSSDVPAGFGIADYADCLAAVIDALAI